jgi:hypothetical protein
MKGLFLDPIIIKQDTVVDLCTIQRATTYVVVNPATLTISQSTDCQPFSGNIAGSGNVIYDNKNISPIYLGISSNLTYTGTTTIQNGIVEVGGINLFPPYSPLILQKNGTLSVTMNNEICSIVGDATTSIVFDNSPTLTVGSSESTIFSGNLVCSSNTDTINLNKVGTGKLDLSNAKSNCKINIAGNTGTVIMPKSS